MNSSIEWYKDKSGFTFKGNLFSPNSMLAHIERLNGVKVLSKKSWFLTDDYEACFSYKDHVFIVYTPFSGIEVTVSENGAPESVTKEVMTHAASFKNVSWVTSLARSIKYFILPFNVR